MCEWWKQARPLLNRASEQGDFEGLADAKMNNGYDREEMARMVACAAACVRHSARRRPRMSQVIFTLTPTILFSYLSCPIYWPYFLSCTLILKYISLTIPNGVNGLC